MFKNIHLHDIYIHLHEKDFKKFILRRIKKKKPTKTEAYIKA